MSPRRYRIMLIEDSRTQAERFSELFVAEGWEVLYAASAEAALEQLGRTRPDVIVLDYYLPGMNGDEFCHEIRMNVNMRGIPVLMLTVEGTGDAERRGLESGADDYLAKAGDPDILLLRVRRLLGKSHGPETIVSETGIFRGAARLLAIGESPTYLEYLAQELGRENCAVTTARGGEEGLERARREAFDCVLVDADMAGSDGIEVCRRLDEMRRGMEAPGAVLLLAPREDKERMTRALEAGADDFVGKSADLAVLKARIRAVLRRRSFMEQNRRIVAELKEKELRAVRLNAEKEAAEERAQLADELARTNRDLSQALEVTRAITDHAADALFMTDKQGRMTFMNPAAERMFGFGRGELLGKPLDETIGLSEGGKVAGANTIAGREGVLRRKDGTQVDVSWSSAPILQEGEVTATVLVVRDESERKRSEERLRQSQKLESIGLLAGGIAHDFNNILTSILGTASLIEEDVPPEAAERLRFIVEGAEKAANLTRQLLAYAGKGQFIVRKLDVSACVRDILALVRLSVPQKVEMRLELAEDLPPISADPGQMQQVIMNLVINAGEAIGAQNKGAIAVGTGVAEVGVGFADAVSAEVAPGRYVYLEVKDTGCGMDESTRAKIFDPFFTTKFTGRGLGLAAVSGIMRSLGGAITIQSAPGKGTTFRALFSTLAKEPAQGGRDRPGVLVIEDEEGVRQFIGSALERHGFSIFLARDGGEGLKVFGSNENSITLVLLDMVMPAVAGRDVLQAIKRRRPEMKILLTSGYGEEEARRLCAAYGGTTFIQKPYTVATLLQKVRAAMEG